MLAEAAEGKRFLLQGGDCAERFEDCTQDVIERKIKILMQMSLVLTWAGLMPTIRIARLAGQYAKPRSKPTEVVNGEEVASFKGDNVNGFDPSDRKPDPQRLVRAYFYSAATLNCVRAAIDAGFGDLHHPSNWDLDFVLDPAKREDYQHLLQYLGNALDFMKACGVTDENAPSLRSVDLYSSHEGLLLPYEEALTRRHGKKYYNLSSHFLWIGDRTRQLDCAHIEYFRGIANPIGVKVGPSMKPAELVELVQTLNPTNEPGRITLITRLGAGKVTQSLPLLVGAVQAAGLKVLWCCDPMHGNTYTSKEGVKTRRFDCILAEILETLDTLKTMGAHLGGVHFELTGDDVTECVGGPLDLKESDLSRLYTTYCDPRLNYHQSMEIAFLLASHLQRQRQEDIDKGRAARRLVDSPELAAAMDARLAAQRKRHAEPAAAPAPKKRPLVMEPDMNDEGESAGAILDRLANAVDE